jgi:hypothetical protein
MIAATILLIFSLIGGYTMVPRKRHILFSTMGTIFLLLILKFPFFAMAIPALIGSLTSLHHTFFVLSKMDCDEEEEE